LSAHDFAENSVWLRDKPLLQSASAPYVWAYVNFP
jgi:hypothetical protein